MPIERDYQSVIENLTPAPEGDRAARMEATVRGLWEVMGAEAGGGCSWVGFYVKNTDLDEMVLAAREPKPACSPIGLHGACGRSFLAKKALVVTNVSNLKAGYIACDPRDRSEVVIPLMDAYNDLCWGVLDVDSFDVHSFTERDVYGLLKVLVHMGLCVEQPVGVEVV